jgi:hypothetical protein
MSEETTQSPAPSGSGLDRRKVLRASAWAAPVVLVATATPAAAASPDPLPPAPSGAVIVFNNVTAFALNPAGTITGVGGNFGARVAWPAETAMLTVTITITSTSPTSQTFSQTFPALTAAADTANIQFTFPNLPAGTYTMTATASGTLETAVNQPTSGPWALAPVSKNADTTVTVA